MPLARIGSKLVYFVHIPKCAGSAVEDYLEERFGLLAFLDRRHLDQAAEERWTRSSPQHVDWTSFNRIVPRSFIDEVFAVVRHPLSRAISAYRFQAEVEGTVPKGMAFGDWLKGEMSARDSDPFRNDNHLRPQTAFLPPAKKLSCTLFHIEHGLDALIPYFDGLEGRTRGARGIRHSNAAGHGTAAAGAWQVGKVDPDPQEITLVSELYAEDFAQLAYDIASPEPLCPPPLLSPETISASASFRALKSRFAHRLKRGFGRRWRALNR